MADEPQRTTRYKVLHRKWPRVGRKATWWLMPLELIGLIPLLVIFGIAQPDLYRTAFWQIGFDNKLNSDPNMILYAYANFRPLPKVPLIWSQTLTDFNVAISIISLFFLLVKLIGFIMSYWFPIVALGINLGIGAIYAVSVYGQIGPDYADKRYPAPAAWYFRFGCGLAEKYGKGSDCKIAQASLGLTLYMLVLYLLNIGFCAYAMWPNPINDEEEEEDENLVKAPVPDTRARTTVEMQSMQNLQGMQSPHSIYSMQSMQALKSPATATGTAFTPRSPFTPRTQAFHTVDPQVFQPQAARYG